jgi:hypothetical protein
MIASLFIVALILSAGMMATAFSTMGSVSRVACRGVKMEYIPDGMSKAQWEALKRKEEENLKKKNLGAVGITKFQSRWVAILFCFIFFMRLVGRNILVVRLYYVPKFTTAK